MKKKGHVVIISGPSGVGKGTIVRNVMSTLSNVQLSVSATTRPKREGEVDHKHYHFLTPEQFDQYVQDDAFLEWCEVHKNRYGTLKEEVENLLNKGTDVIVEIDIQGFEKIKQKIDRYSSIFIAPPNFQELFARLKGRNTEKDDVIQYRLAMAGKELAAIGEYDYIVINKNVEHATEDVLQVIENLRSQTIG